MFKVNKIFTIVYLATFISIFITNVSYSNSAEPPSILIIVSNAPGDLEISIGTEDTFTKARETDKLLAYSRSIKCLDQ